MSAVGELPTTYQFYEGLNLLGAADFPREPIIDRLTDRGIDLTRIYNPMLPQGVEDTDNVLSEVFFLRTNRSNTLVVSPETRSLISLIELGHAATNAVFGADLYTQITDYQGNDEAALRARQLITRATAEMRRLLPSDLVEIVMPTASASEQQSRLTAWIDTVGSRVLKAQRRGIDWAQVTPPLLEVQPLGQPQVHLSGTSVATSAAKEAFGREASRTGLQVVDSYTGSTYGQHDIDTEYDILKSSQVSAVMITNDTESIGSCADAPLRAALTAMNLNRRGQKGKPLSQGFGIYIEEPDPTKLSKYAVEMRQTLMLHMRAMQRTHSGIYIAKSPEELAAWAQRSITR